MFKEKRKYINPKKIQKIAHKLVIKPQKYVITYHKAIKVYHYNVLLNKVQF